MKLNTKPDWATRICSKLAVFGALSLSTALFAQTQPTPLPITENPFTETAVEESAPNSDTATYIPIDNRVKDGLYGFTKAVTMGVTFPLMLTVNAAPFGNPLSAANQGVYEFFSRQCHQLPQRTFTASNGRLFPLCARCHGMTVGYFLGTFDFLIWDAFEIPGLQRWEQGLLHIGTYAALFLPLIIDGTVQYFSFDYESNNAWRMTTGLLFGYALTAIIDEIVQLILDYPGVYRHRRGSTDS